MGRCLFRNIITVRWFHSDGLVATTSQSLGFLKNNKRCAVLNLEGFSCAAAGSALDCFDRLRLGRVRGETSAGWLVVELIAASGEESRTKDIQNCVQPRVAVGKSREYAAQAYHEIPGLASEQRQHRTPDSTTGSKHMTNSYL